LNFINNLNCAKMEAEKENVQAN
jgi:aspartate beta-hydroxylase